MKKPTLPMTLRIFIYELFLSRQIFQKRCYFSDIVEWKNIHVVGQFMISCAIDTISLRRQNIAGNATRASRQAVQSRRAPSGDYHIEVAFVAPIFILSHRVSINMTRILDARINRFGPSRHE